MKKLIAMYKIIILGFVIMVTFSGCSKSQKSKSTTDAASEQTVGTQVQQTPSAPEFSEKEIKAQKQLEFAQNYMDLANNQNFPYDQSIAICRDVIKNNPDTEYETLAREILRQVPEDKRGRYNITNEELGL